MIEEPVPVSVARLRIMIIDDEPIVCKRLQSAFQKAGYAVEAFTDSHTALARLTESKFDVIVTDLKMEGADGIQVLMGAKQHHPQTQVIVITGFATMETAKESFHQGAFDFVAKPFKLSDILDCVRRIEGRIRGTDHGTGPEISRPGAAV
jgi:DNA-binding NtrC family response regulator